MCGQQPSAQDEIVSIKRKHSDDLQKRYSVKKARKFLTYSNSMGDSVKTFCCHCDKVVTLSGLEEHILSHNKMTIKEYKKLYGNPRTQITKPVFHKCGLCTEELLLDANIIAKHVKKCHQMEFNAYSIKFLSTARESSGVVIRCDKCSKTFKRNIQLKAHSKRHNLSNNEDVGFSGFKTHEPRGEKQCLDELIKTFETEIHRERQAFQQFLNLVY